MPEKRRAWLATPRCIIIVVLIALAGYGLWLFLKPSNSTSVGEVLGKLTEHDSFIDFDPAVDVHLHGSGCWATIAVLTTLVILILSAIAIIPRLKARRAKKRAAKEELTLQLQSLAKQNKDQQAAAAQELALLREASNRRLQSLNAEMVQLRAETHSIITQQNSRDKILP